MSEEQKQENNQCDNFEKLDQFIEVVNPKVKDYVKDAIDDIQKKKEQKVREQTVELVTQALSLKGQMDKATKDFEQQKNKWNKELGKLLGKLQG